MWWHCTYRAQPQIRASDLIRRFLRQHDAGTNQPSQIRGWFTFPTGVDGIVFIEADTPKELATVLEPYSRLVHWEVEAISELNYNQMLEELRRSTHRSAIDDLMAGVPPAVVAGAPEN
jgi:hypothetical protein